MSRSELLGGRSKKPYLLWFSLLCFVSPAVSQKTQEATALLSKPTATPSSKFSMPSAPSTLNSTDVSVAELVDALVNIDAQAAGLHSTAMVRAFIADNSPDEFEGGVIGSVAPKKFPQMTELVRRGVSSLPLLIKHLDDKRPTKLIVGGKFFMFEYFSDEYDPKTPVPRNRPAEALEKNIDGKYAVRVGDVCYALVGQIVNRDLLAIRYQPTAGLIVNSPIEAPVLIEEVRRDWGDTDANEHMASLLADARAGQNLWEYGPALRRLRFYYPDEYHQQAVGALKEKIRKFESSKKKQE
jgi:hypothetical protein